MDATIVWGILAFIWAAARENWPVLTPFAGFVALLLALNAAVRWRLRRRMARLRAQSAQFGWHPITDPVPGPVATALRSRRCKLALAMQYEGRQVWMIYHQWTERSASRRSERVEDLMRYFLDLGPGYPSILLRRRTVMDGDQWPVEGMGGLVEKFIDGMRGLPDSYTGDAEFDRRFSFQVLQTHQVRHATAEPLRLLTPPVRAAMVADQLPLWGLDGGILSIRYPYEPDADRLQAGAEAIVRLAGMLPGPPA